MKLVIAIVSRDDEQVLLAEMAKENFRTTKIASTGGFLKSGNSTFICGVEDERVELLTQLVSKHCSKRELLQSVSPLALQNAGIAAAYAQQVTVGGATMFIIDVEDYKQV